MIIGSIKVLVSYKFSLIKSSSAPSDLNQEHHLSYPEYHKLSCNYHFLRKLKTFFILNTADTFTEDLRLKSNLNQFSY